MPLIIEDGSNVPNANSYVSVTEIREFAALRGLVVPVDDSAVEMLAIKGTDYLESFRKRYQGLKTYPDQSLQFPRTGVVVDRVEHLSSDEIPNTLKMANIISAITSYKTELLPEEKQTIKKKKVDVIEIEYQDGSSSLPKIFSKVSVHLEPLFRASGMSLTSRRG